MDAPPDTPPARASNTTPNSPETASSDAALLAELESDLAAKRLVRPIVEPKRFDATLARLEQSRPGDEERERRRVERERESQRREIERRLAEFQRTRGERYEACSLANYVLTDPKQQRPHSRLTAFAADLRGHIEH